ncbi:MAG TPA: molybdopterin-dependent oxidoreductase, partial [Solirubrobacteraceae bacterium]
HDGHPYVAPFSGNIIELCPVGALTSQPYRFRARPWDNESAGGVCTLCPAQCNVTFTVRDDRVVRVLARDYEGNREVDDGWLCDKGRFAYQAMHVDERITSPLVRDGGELRPVSWERALGAAAGLGRHKGRVGALVGGQASNEEGFILQRLMRESLASPDIDSRLTGALPAPLARALAAPELQARVSDLEFADTLLVLDCDPRDDMPIIDLRIRKGVRRNGVKLVVASSRPTALDQNATVISRYSPGTVEQFLTELQSSLDDQAQDGQGQGELAELLRGGGDDVVIVWSERIGAQAAARLLGIVDRLGIGEHPGAGLLQIPGGANGRGLREAGAVPDAGPGYATLTNPGRGAAQIARAAADGELTALYLMQTDPLRDQPDRARWESALQSAALVVAHASVLTEGLREHANVIFPAESHAEKEGTVVHPDGRLQRLRIAIAHPGEVKAGWAVLAELARRTGTDFGIERSADAFEQLVAAVGVYEGLTLDELGGHGVRWPERPQSAPLAGAASERPAVVPTPPPEPDAAGNGSLRLGSYRPIWAAPEVEISPALKYLVPHQHLELSPADAQRLGIEHGDRVQASSNGTRVSAVAAVRSGVPAGSAFLADGLAEDSANALTEPLIEVRKVEAVAAAAEGDGGAE